MAMMLDDKNLGRIYTKEVIQQYIDDVLGYIDNFKSELVSFNEFNVNYIGHIFY